ncbi:hypothetical protein HPB47_010916 [Ixodes persulcatus]|uniref:Uncharacterized protein n=1 Tax=Ixodes persulcatus TaxID=34615 RepID=A0AC60NXY1_IXOPE|nr:hypothetical protein HPB47_010916 [Ixodes persulcatus]
MPNHSVGLEKEGGGYEEDRPGTQECAGLATAPAECVLVPQGRELRDSSACPPPSLGSSGLHKTRNPTLRPLSRLHLRNDRRLQDPT